MEGSFHPPSVDPDGANPSGYPFWVLLDNRAYFADRDNATTVQATTSAGHDVKITFCLADPPVVSYLCVHCAATSIQDFCATEPRVVSSAKDLALLCFAFRFRTGPQSSMDDDSAHAAHHLEYLVYKAAPGGKHTIRPVPRSPPGYRHSWHAAIVPGEGDNFLVADLSLNNGEDLGHYNLHVFSSETNEWSTKHLQLQTPPDVLPWDLPSQTDKVISLGESTVGWVDLWRGIVVCDVLEEEPLLRFLPLPKADFDLHRRSRARQVRDVVGFPNGFINFVEVEHCVRWFVVARKSALKTAERFDVADAIYDELLRHDDMDDDVTDDKPVRHAPAGWKIRTMSRSVDWDYWDKSHTTLHVDDISAAYPPEPSKLLSHLWNDRDRKWALGNLKATGFPTFGVYGGDVVYLVSKVESQDEDALLIGVDIGKKKLEVIEPYRRGRSISFDPFPVVGVDVEKKLEVVEPYFGGRSTYFDPISCGFSEYLNTTPSPRACDEEVAAESPQNEEAVGESAPNEDFAAESAQNDEVAAEFAHTCVLNDNISSGHTVANDVEPQNNTWNWDSRYGSWDQYSYGAHPGYYGNYQQPYAFQSPSLTQTGQPTWSTTSTQLEGYIYARWTLPDAYGRMYLSVPLSEMHNPFAIWTLTMPVQLPFAQPFVPWQFFAPPLTRW